VSQTTIPSSSAASIVSLPAAPAADGGSRDVLTDILHDGARRMLAVAVDTEVQVWLDARAHLTDEHGRRLVVRNGHLPGREVLTGVGPVAVRQPRVRDKRPHQERERFTSAILPPYLRKAKSIEDLIPWLYLKGVSTGDFSEALTALLGENAPGLSATTVTRLKEVWRTEYETWGRRSLKEKTYVYLWADGVHFNIRLADEGAAHQCILVLMGATADGSKELIAVTDGWRESEQSWKELLLDCKSRGLTVDPKLAVGDGALGFWKALPQVWPATRTQRCWVHKTANVLNKLPRGLQGKAKKMLWEIWMAAGRAAAEKALDLFVESFSAKHPAAAECLKKDRTELLAFYDFPAEHWIHLRTTNPIESVFSTVRLRTDKTRGAGSRSACLTMVFKLMQSAAKGWRLLNGSSLLGEVIAGVPFVDGVRKSAA